MYTIIHELDNIIHQGDIASCLAVLLAFKQLGGINFDKLYVIDPQGNEHSSSVWAGQF
jgi:hypothetical protein